MYFYVEDKRLKMKIENLSNVRLCITMCNFEFRK